MAVEWSAMAMRIAWALVCVAVVAGCRGDPLDGRRLTGPEIEALFADRTVEGHHEVWGYDFRSYYDPGGTFRSHQSDKDAPRDARWWVAGDGICIEWADDPGPLCRIMLEKDGTYRKVRHDETVTKTVVTFVRFTPGNPEGL